MNAPVHFTKAILLATLLCLVTTCALAQVSVSPDNAPADPSAMLDVQSTDKGMLVPRMTTAQRELISNPATGLLVFDTNTGGFWFFDGISWADLSADSNKIFEVNNNVVRTGEDVDESTADFVFGSPQLDWDGTSAHNSRMFFDKSKAAFRAGYTPHNQWDSDSVGQWSAAFGSANTASGLASFIGGGTDNTASGRYSAVIGGIGNKSTADYTCVAGGNMNLSSGLLAFVGGGYFNEASAFGASVVGGQLNKASGEFSLAAGVNAKALHNNTFIWNAESTDMFQSTAPQQFLVKAPGGVGINKNDPTTALDVNGTVTATAFAGDGSSLTNIDKDDADADPVNEIQNLAGVLNEGNDGNGTDLINLGAVSATSFSGDGSALTNVPGDDLGDHAATSDIILNNNWITNGVEDRGIQVDSNGSVKMTAKNQVTTLELESSDSPNIRLYQSDNSGWPEYTWDIVGNEANYFIRDVNSLDANGYSKIPFRIKPGSASNRISIKGDNVGIGKEHPNSTLDVNGTATATAFVGDGSGLTNVPGDDLGSHTATSNIELDGNWIINGTSDRGMSVDSNGTLSVTSELAKPGLYLTSGNTPSISFYQYPTYWGEHQWDISANEQYIYFTDVSNGSTVPFTIRTGSAANRLYIKGENVGIGKTNPNSTLDVNGTAKATAFVGDGSGLTNVPGDDLGSHTATENLVTDGHWLSGDGGNEGVFVDSHGSVGIGTSIPGEKLEVAGKVKLHANDPAVIFHDNSPDWNRTSAIKTYMSGGVPEGDIPQYQRMYFEVSQGYDGSTSVPLMLLGNGNVGVSVTDPSENLDVNGNVRIRGGDPVEGAVLTATGSDGTATWVAPPTPEAPEERVFNAYIAETFGFESDVEYAVVTTPQFEAYSGQVIMVHGLASGLLLDGYGEDPFEIRIKLSGCGEDIYSATRVYTPHNAAPAHYYPVSMPTFAKFIAPCNGTFTFSYMVNNTGDDAYEIHDASIAAIKY